MQKKVSLIIIFLLAFIISMNTTTRLVTVAFAQESESETATASSDVGTELDKRIQKWFEEKHEQVKGAVDSLLSEKRAIIGEVLRVTDETITIEHLGETTIVPLTEGVTVLKNEKTITATDVAVGNWATVLGNKQRATVEPEFIVIYDETLLPKEQIVLLGSITDLTRTSFTIEPRGDQAPKTVRFTSETRVEGPSGEDALVSDLSTDLTVLVSAFISEDTIEASTIRSLAEIE